MPQKGAWCRPGAAPVPQKGTLWGQGTAPGPVAQKGAWSGPGAAPVPAERRLVQAGGSAGACRKTPCEGRGQHQGRCLRKALCGAGGSPSGHRKALYGAGGSTSPSAPERRFVRPGGGSERRVPHRPGPRRRGRRPARKRGAWTALVGMISLERPAIFFPLLCVVLGGGWRCMCRGRRAAAHVRSPPGRPAALGRHSPCPCPAASWPPSPCLG